MNGAGLSPRRAGASDAAAVRELTRQSYAKWIPVIGREPKPMAADFEAAIRLHWVDVIEDATGLLAFIEMIPEPSNLLIENIAVREDQQGRGLGSLLLLHAEGVAKSRGLAELRLYTNAAFASNLAFYAHRGYGETARTPLSGGGTMVHFAKTVS